MPMSEPRTPVPVDEWGEDYPRYAGHADDREACPDCGGYMADLWMREGAVGAVLRCVYCCCWWRVEPEQSEPAEVDA